MKRLPETRELLAVAERVVWFKTPAEALADPVHFLAHVMTYGTVEDLRALDGVVGTTALHMCFGYAAIVHDRPGQYAFLPELNACVAQQISIEAAQPNLDLSVLGQLPNKTIILGVLNLGDEQVETPQVVADRIRSALRQIEPERLVVAPDCGMKYLPRDVAFAKLQAMVEGAKIVREELS